MSESEQLINALSDGENEYVAVDELCMHPKNEEVYGEIDPGESFIEDVRRNGVETPLIVNQHEDTQNKWDLPNTIIGGHRRLHAAKEVGLERVLVRWVEYPEPMATRRLVKNNNQRDKSPAQQTREALLLEETAREIGKENMSQGGEGRLNLDDPEYRWDEDVAQEIGVGKDTVRKGTDVFRFAYPDKYVHEDVRNPEKYDVPDEVREEARKQIQAMEGEQSFHGAHKTVMKAKQRAESKSTDKKVQQKSNEQHRDEFDVEQGDIYEVVGDVTHVVQCGNALNQDIMNGLVQEYSIDTAIVDPPYGVSEDTNRGEKGRSNLATSYDLPKVEGDESIQTAVAFHSLLNKFGLELSVYWGAKNYAHEIPPSKGWIVWDKRDGVASDDNSDFELAWTNQDRASRMYRHLWKGAIKASESDQRRIHPTQKPIELSKWILSEFARHEPDCVLYPFAGSGSGLLAAERCGITSVNVELSPEYVGAILKRCSETGMEVINGEN